MNRKLRRSPNATLVILDFDLLGTALTQGGHRMPNEKLKAYRDAWIKLREEVLNEKTSWGKEELKKRMDALLIATLESYLS